MEAGCNIVRDNFTGSSLSERLKDETPINEGTPRGYCKRESNIRYKMFTLQMLISLDSIIAVLLQLRIWFGSRQSATLYDDDEAWHRA